MNCLNKAKNITSKYRLNKCTSKKCLLSEHLDAIKDKIESANNLKEFFEVFIFVKSLNLKFKNEKLGSFYMNVAGLIFIIALCLLGFFMNRLSFEAIRCFFWIVFGCVIFIIINVGFVFKEISYTKKISDAIAFKKAALDNNFILKKSNKKKLLKFFKDLFLMFEQGNYSRKLIQYIKGGYKDKFVYHYFHFHYVDEDDDSSSDENGNIKSETKYYHYDFYGIIIPFAGESFIKISNCQTISKFNKWRTSSISFNRKFKVYTDNEQAVAVFLQPKVIEQIEELYETFPELDIEISSQGFLALSTPDEELLNYTRQYGVDQLDLFEEEIKKVLDQIKLHKTLEFINFLKEYHAQT
ncbi:MAG: DUF3137 domain-containing protein [Gammaproteobacteria bacterium]